MSNFYNHIIEKVYKHADLGDNVISYKKVRWVLGKLLVPRSMHHTIIREMIFFKMLKRNSKRSLTIIARRLSLEETPETSLGIPLTQS